MYEDIINPNDREKYYYMGSYLKPYYSCEPCNLTMLTMPDGNGTELCPWCGKLLTVEFAPLTFAQSNDYATVSC